MRNRITLRLWFIYVGCLCGLSGTVHAGPAQLGFSATATYSTVLQGYQDTVNGYVYNLAPTGSAILNYSVQSNFPSNSPVTQSGTRAADGGAGYDTLLFNLNTAKVTPGTVPISLTATNTVSGGSITQSGSITVLAHAKPGFYVGGNVVTLSPTPITEPTTPEPAFQTSAAESSGFAVPAPSLIGDPPPDVPTDEMDLDSVVPIGDPEISITLQPFTDLPPDDPADAPPDIINVDATVDGTYFTQFQLNYSDEQDLPGAYAPGSEQAYFAVLAVVGGSGADQTTDVYVYVPEPASISVLAIAGAATLMCRRRRNALA